MIEVIRLVGASIGIPLWIAGAFAMAYGFWPITQISSTVADGAIIGILGAALIVVPIVATWEE